MAEQSACGGEAAGQGSQAWDDSRDDTDILEGSEQGLGMLRRGLDMNRLPPQYCLWDGTAMAEAAWAALQKILRRENLRVVRPAELRIR